jgi:hypothetical protein
LFKPATESTKIATEASKEKHEDTSAALKRLRAQLNILENPFATFLSERVLPAPSKKIYILVDPNKDLDLDFPKTWF